MCSKVRGGGAEGWEGLGWREMHFGMLVVMRAGWDVVTMGWHSR